MPSTVPKQKRELENRIRQLNEQVAQLTLLNRHQRVRERMLKAFTAGLALWEQRENELELECYGFEQSQQSQQQEDEARDDQQHQQQHSSRPEGDAPSDEQQHQPRPQEQPQDACEQPQEQPQDACEQLEPINAPFSPLDDPLKHFRGLLQRPVMEAAATVTPRGLAKILREVAMQSSIIMVQLQTASAEEQPSLLQELQATWDRGLHALVSVVLCGRTSVFMEAMAVWNLQTMKPDPEGAAAHEAVIASRLQKLQLSPEQEENIAVGVQVVMQHMGAIALKRQQLQAELLAPATATTADSAAVANGRNSSVGGAGAGNGAAVACDGTRGVTGSGTEDGSRGTGSSDGNAPNEAAAQGTSSSPDSTRVSTGTGFPGAAAASSGSHAANGSQAGSCIRTDVTLHKRQRENADTQQRMMQLDQLLHRESYTRISLVWALSGLTLCQLAQVAAACWPYHIRGYVGRAILERWQQRHPHLQQQQQQLLQQQQPQQQPPAPDMPPEALTSPGACSGQKV